MRKALLSDIDGTITDRRHRLHYLDGKKDWESFFNESIFDPPINETITQIETLLPRYDKLIFVTGRPEQYREITNEWILSNTKFSNYDLIMRINKDYRSDISIKKEMLNVIKKDFKIDIIFEDQIDLANMWKKQGLNCRLIE